MQIQDPVYPVADDTTSAATYAKKKKAADTHARVKAKTGNIANLVGEQIAACSDEIYGGTIAEAQAVADSIGHDAFTQVSFETTVQNFLRYKRGLAPVAAIPTGKILVITAGGDAINYDTLIGQLESLFTQYVPGNTVVTIADAPAE